MRKAKLLTLLLTAMGAFACGPDLGASGASCGEDGACPDGQRCYRGFCLPNDAPTAPPVYEPAQALDAGALDAMSSEQPPENGALTPPAQPSSGPDAGSGLERDAAQSPSEKDPTPPMQSPPAQPPKQPAPTRQPDSDASTPSPRPQVIACTDRSNCKPECAAGATCEISCSDIDNCEIDCSGRCAATCVDTSNCRMRCRRGATCELDCRQADGNCEKIRCEDGASCLLRCGGSEHCEFERCAGSELSCPNGDRACNHACP